MFKPCQVPIVFDNTIHHGATFGPAHLAARPLGDFIIGPTALAQPLPPYCQGSPNADQVVPVDLLGTPFRKQSGVNNDRPEFPRLPGPLDASIEFLQEIRMNEPIEPDGAVGAAESPAGQYGALDSGGAEDVFAKGGRQFTPELCRPIDHNLADFIAGDQGSAPLFE